MPEPMRKRHRAAIAVFVDVDSHVDDEAGALASIAIQSALTGSPHAAPPVELPVPLKNADGITVRVVDVMDLGMAAGNGYLWTRPTMRAWRDAGMNEEDGE